MIRVPDTASIAAMRHAQAVLGRRVRPSTGANLWGAIQIAAELALAGDAGSIVSLLCDGGEGCSDTH